MMRELFTKIKENLKLILYIMLLLGLSTYVVINWDKCISMRFFKYFNGNNILFLVWLAMLILQFHDVEIKDFKVRVNVTDMERAYNNADTNFLENRENNTINAQDSEEENEGGNI
ncbi:MAG: hypothetical protein J1F64_04355 [Oscillospiraceae bacterium]|nr:hypothetical protein [Oscillospiraceae bacterium]